MAETGDDSNHPFKSHPAEAGSVLRSFVPMLDFALPAGSGSTVCAF